MSSVAELLAGGGKSWTGDKKGDSIEGRILTAEAQQQTDLDTDEPVFWDVAKTRPKMMVVVSLQTSAKEDDDDDGKRTIYASGNKFTALQKAVSESGAKDVLPDDYLKFVFEGESTREPKKRGHNPAKLYSAVHKPKHYAEASGVSMGEDGPAATTVAAATPSTPALASTSATHGPRPDYLPEEAWANMTAEQKAAVSPPQAGPTKPDYIPAEAWAKMTDEQKAVVAG